MGFFNIYIYMSGLTSIKSGVMVLINNNFDQDVTKVLRDPNRNFLILEISIRNKSYFLNICDRL